MIPNHDHPLKVDAATLEELIRTSELPVLVDFYADWCMPCRLMAPILDEFARDHAGEAIVLKLDTDRNPGVAEQYGIRGIPTLLIFKDGEEVERQVGAVPGAYLDNLLATIEA
ncbi:MAG TPA: thioredoxin [Gemmatimonadaceae bacterium]|nr:thioredoxin [Gemmatimonadaceae bacterium]